LPYLRIGSRGALLSNMEKKPEYTRPPFEEALKAWGKLLGERGFPSELIWVFDENLCFERDPASPGGFRLGFQTVFTPAPPDAEQIAYDHFSEFDAPLIWYRLGSCGGKSVSLLLCDPWFQNKTEAEGFLKRPDWLILFRPGAAIELEEVKDKGRWANRIVRERPLHDLDFCMTLRAVHEMLAHGRVLTAYERYALKLLHVWRHLLGDPR
jgi:hypothetical protein